MRASRLFVAAVTAWRILAAAAFADPGRPPLAQLVAVNPTDAPRSGTEVHAGLEIRLPDGVHVNSNQPRDPSLIPLSVTVDAPTGIRVTGVTFPAAVDVRQRGEDVPLSVFQHTFVVGVGLRLAADLPAAPVVVPVHVRYQACDETRCYIPATAETAWTLTVVPAADAPAPVSAAVPDLLTRLDRFAVAHTAAGYLTAREFTSFLQAATGGEAERKPFAGRSFGAIVLLVLVGGLALNLTPCVLPLIPINLAILGAGATARSRGRGLLIGTAYGAAMAAVYGASGVVVILTAGVFGTLNASPWFNAIVATVFVLLALAMFDVFFIDFSRFSGRVNPSADRGSIALALAMGAMAALLAGACVAPVILQVVIFSSDLYASGTRAALALPLALGLGMAAPWPLAGAGLAALPKPGPWMIRVKQTLGIAILILAGYYAHLAYGLMGTRPPLAAVSGPRWHASLEEGLQIAEREGRPVLVDLWATWCKNCFAMDRTTLSDPAVMSALTGYVQVKFQAEDPDDPRVRGVMQRFGAVGLPTYVVLQPRRAAASGPAGTPAPDFSLPNVTGQMGSLSALRGRIVVLNFWATWCAPCRTEIPELMRLRANFGDAVAVVGIAMDEGDGSAVRRFVSKERFHAGASSDRINYPVLLGTPGVGDAYGIEGLPTTLLIDRSGRVARRFEMPVRSADLEPEIRRLLAASMKDAGKAGEPGEGEKAR